MKIVQFGHRKKYRMKHFCEWSFGIENTVKRGLPILTTYEKLECDVNKLPETLQIFWHEQACKHARTHTHTHTHTHTFLANSTKDLVNNKI